MLASGTKSGYTFVYTPGATDNNGNVLSYTITAVPTSPNNAGQTTYFTDQSGVIRDDPSGAAPSVNDSPLGQ